jgi:hypothetical protein
MALSTVPQIRSHANLGRMYSLLVSILLQTFRSRVLLPTIGTQVSVMAFRSSPVADSAVPLAAGFVRPTIRLGDLFLFNGVSAVTCSIILQVAGFKVPESTELGQLNMLDFADIAAYGFVKIDDFPVGSRKGSEKLKDVLGVLS